MPYEVLFLHLVLNLKVFHLHLPNHGQVVFPHLHQHFQVLLLHLLLHPPHRHVLRLCQPLLVRLAQREHIEPGENIENNDDNDKNNKTIMIKMMTLFG